MIEDLLDHIHRETRDPLLVRVEASQACLTIGLGHPDVSVSLYLDTDNTPSHAVGNPRLAHHEPISFASTNAEHSHDFYRTAHIELDAARAVAREFYLQPTMRPQSVNWLPEGDPAPECMWRQAIRWVGLIRR